MKQYLRVNETFDEVFETRLNRFALEGWVLVHVSDFGSRYALMEKDLVQLTKKEKK